MRQKEVNLGLLTDAVFEFFDQIEGRAIFALTTASQPGEEDVRFVQKEPFQSTIVAFQRIFVQINGESFDSSRRMPQSGWKHVQIVLTDVQHANLLERGQDVLFEAGEAVVGQVKRG